MSKFALKLFAILVLTQCCSLHAKYNRKDWGNWKDEDRDCINTRHEILQRDNVGTLVMKNKCQVLSGKWKDAYTGEEVTDPKELQIDHVVPVKVAHELAGHAWSKQEKAKFYNDPDNLVVATKHTNTSKGAKSFVDWIPGTKKEFACNFANRWMLVKRKYNLTISNAETENLKFLNCLN